MHIATVCFLVPDAQILLGMKKQGFGAGKWNGLGGKVQDGETVEAAAVREIREEAKLEVLSEDLEQVGTLTFFFAGEPKWLVHAFLVRRWRGEPIETDEMRPQWFAFDAIPYDEMWVADRKWLPLALAGKRIRADIHFSADGETLEKFTWSDAAFPASGIRPSLDP